MKLLLLSIILFPISICAQQLKMEEVVELADGSTKEQLYSRAEAWFAKSYYRKMPKAYAKNPVDGIIDGTFEVHRDTYTDVISIMSRISIRVLDGKYMYSFSKFVHSKTLVDGSDASLGLITTDETYPYVEEGKKLKKSDQRHWEWTKGDIDKKMPDLITNLKTHMKTSQ